MIVRVFLSTLLLTASISSPALSVADKLVPPAFDPGSKYETYTLYELADQVDNFPLAKERLANAKVKVFALYNTSVDELPNFITRRGGSETEGFGCLSEVCKTLSYLSFHEPGLIRADAVLNYSSPKIMLRISDRKKFEDFRKDAKPKCTQFRSCQLWIRGTLHFFVAPLRLRVVGDTTSDIVYVEVEEVRLYEGTEYNLVRSLKQGAKISIELMKPILAKKYGL